MSWTVLWCFHLSLVCSKRRWCSHLSFVHVRPSRYVDILIGFLYPKRYGDVPNQVLYVLDGKLLSHPSFECPGWYTVKKRFTSFPSPVGMSLTKLPRGRNNSVMTSLFPPRESLLVTSRLGTGNSRTFFLRCMLLTHLSFGCPGRYAIISRSHLSFVCPGWYAIASRSHPSFVCPERYAIVLMSRRLSFVCPGRYAIVSPKFCMSWMVCYCLT
jgi:hypothetical protein